MNRRITSSFRKLLAVIMTMLLPASSYAAITCEDLFRDHATGESISHSSYNEVVAVMNRAPYDLDHLPLIPIQMFKWIGNRLTFFVGQRSREILTETRDYRAVGMNKPIHPMGVGLTGTMSMQKSRWSGIFRGGQFPIVARASISQDNPFKFQPNGEMQVRSTAMAIKVFGSLDRSADVRTANAVFQNNLNGLLGKDGRPLNFLESPQTNQPGLDFAKINQAYQVETLLGVAYGSIVSPKDHMSKIPFINPQIRPVHSWAEMGETDSRAVKPPVWVKIEPKLLGPVIDQNDFRLEIIDTLKRDGKIIYEISAADQQDSLGRIQWETVGTVTFDQYLASAGVDQNLLFPHDSLNSKFTGQKFKIPDPSNQFDSVPDDVQ